MKILKNLLSFIYSLDGLTDSNMRPLENTSFLSCSVLDLVTVSKIDMIHFCKLEYQNVTIILFSAAFNLISSTSIILPFDVSLMYTYVVPCEIRYFISFRYTFATFWFTVTSQRLSNTLPPSQNFYLHLGLANFIISTMTCAKVAKVCFSSLPEKNIITSE